MEHLGASDAPGITFGGSQKLKPRCSTMHQMRHDAPLMLPTVFLMLGASLLYTIDAPQCSSSNEKPAVMLQMLHDAPL
jgi:hypothetical protein